MTKLPKTWRLLLALGLLCAPIGARAQTQEDDEEDLTGNVSTDDLWGDEEEEEEEEAAEEAEAAPARSPWSASLSYGHEALLRPLLVGGDEADPTYNPYYGHSLSIAPAWTFDDHWKLGASVGLSQELTNPDDRTGRYDVWVSSGASLSYAKLFEYQEISFNPKLGVTFPTTPAQQVATLYFAMSPGFSVSRTFEQVLRGLTLSYAFSFTKNFHRYREASTPPQPIACESATDTENCTTTSSGGRNTNLSLSNSLSASLGLTDKLSVGLSGSIGHALAYSLTGATMDDALTGEHNGVEDTAEPIGEHDAQGGWRFTQSLGASVDYGVLDYLSASFGVTTAGPQLDPSSERYNPFLPNRNTTAGLTLSLSVDALVKEIAPARTAERPARVATSHAGPRRGPAPGPSESE